MCCCVNLLFRSAAESEKKTCTESFGPQITTNVSPFSLSVLFFRNDEIQSIRNLKASDVNERVMKAKLEYKVLSEFASACRATSMAITEGLIAPLSFGDPSQSEIYVYNGIFFSKAEDSKDSFKVLFNDNRCVILWYICEAYDCG